MATVTPNDRAITAANTLIALASQLELLTEQALAFQAAYGVQNWPTVWSALGTTATAADGTLGTADGTPNTAHAIDTRIYPGLSKAVSETALANGYNALSAFISMMTGSAVTTFNYRSQVLPLSA